MEHPSLFEQIKETGLSEEQAVLTLHVLGNFAKEKFPILEGNINAYLKQEFKQADPLLIEKLLVTKSIS